MCLIGTQAKAQEILCVDNDKDMNQQMAQHDETLKFIGVNKLGQIFFVYAGQASWTVWFIRPEGAICTGLMYLGEILQLGDPA